MQRGSRDNAHAPTSCLYQHLRLRSCGYQYTCGTVIFGIREHLQFVNESHFFSWRYNLTCSAAATQVWPGLYPCARRSPSILSSNFMCFTNKSQCCLPPAPLYVTPFIESVFSAFYIPLHLYRSAASFRSFKCCIWERIFLVNRKEALRWIDPIKSFMDAPR
jgi:hypothetical protein